MPDHIRNHLPVEAQKLYIEAYNERWRNYDEAKVLAGQSREAVAHHAGWAAVKEAFVHNEEAGIWYRKGEEPDFK